MNILLPPLHIPSKDSIIYHVPNQKDGTLNTTQVFQHYSLIIFWLYLNEVVSSEKTSDKITDKIIYQFVCPRVYYNILQQFQVFPYVVTSHQTNLSSVEVMVLGLTIDDFEEKNCSFELQEISLVFFWYYPFVVEWYVSVTKGARWLLYIRRSVRIGRMTSHLLKCVPCMIVKRTILRVVWENKAPNVGIEPTTTRLRVVRSTNWAD